MSFLISDYFKSLLRLCVRLIDFSDIFPFVPAPLDHLTLNPVQRPVSLYDPLCLLTNDSTFSLSNYQVLQFSPPSQSTHHPLRFLQAYQPTCVWLTPRVLRHAQGKTYGENFQIASRFTCVPMSVPGFPPQFRIPLILCNWLSQRRWDISWDCLRHFRLTLGILVWVMTHDCGISDVFDHVVEILQKINKRFSRSYV